MAKESHYSAFRRCKVEIIFALTEFIISAVYRLKGYV